MAGRFKYLTDNNLSLTSIWHWAKQLVSDLNKLSSTMLLVPSVPTGSVTTYAGEIAPEGWLLCDGGLYPKDSYPELFIALGYAWGGAGDFFNVPDFRDRFLIGAGTVLRLAERGGSRDYFTSQIDSLDKIAPPLADNVQRLATFEVENDSKGDLDTTSDFLPPAVGVHMIIKAK